MRPALIAVNNAGYFSIRQITPEVICPNYISLAQIASESHARNWHQLILGERKENSRKIYFMSPTLPARAISFKGPRTLPSMAIRKSLHTNVLSCQHSCGVR